MSGRTEILEQQIIDHEVRMSRALEGLAKVRGGRQGRVGQRAALAEQDWYREEIVSILKAAATEQELADLGLSDTVIRGTAALRSGSSGMKRTLRLRASPRVAL